jgi:hypothetical protein
MQVLNCPHLLHQLPQRNNTIFNTYTRLAISQSRVVIHTNSTRLTPQRTTLTNLGRLLISSYAYCLPKAVYPRLEKHWDDYGEIKMEILLGQVTDMDLDKG